MRDALRLLFVVGVVAGAPAEAQDDDLELLLHWSYVYGSDAATRLRPSVLWCGAAFKETRGGPCKPDRKARRGVARERVEIRGKVLEMNGYREENEIALNVLLDHLWVPEAPEDILYPINTTTRISESITPHNVIHFGLGPRGSSRLDEDGHAWGGPSAAVIHVEVNGCGPGPDIFPKRVCRIPFDSLPDWVSVAGRPNSVWPFDPYNPPSIVDSALKVGDYVRLVGTLWEDDPHMGGFLGTGCIDIPFQYDAGRVCGGKGGAKGEEAKDYWDGGGTSKRGWIELHPVDFMAKIEPPKLTETISVLVVCCYRDLTMTTVIRPPSPRPHPNAVIGYEEIVDNAFTVWSSVETPNRVTVMADGIRVRVRVKEGGILGIGGHGAKFKALYRVFWRN